MIQHKTSRYDDTTGLSYYGLRFYIPEMIRWMTRDPLGEAGGINLYAFVGNNPVNWVEPCGLLPGDALNPHGKISANQGLPSLPPGLVTGTYGGGLSIPKIHIPTLAVGTGLAGLIGALFINPPVAHMEGEEIDDINDAVGCDDAYIREQDPCRGLRKILQEHRKKLAEYMEDPYAHNNKGFLVNSPPERHPQIVAGRIKNLQRQIENFRKQLEACERLHGM